MYIPFLFHLYLINVKTTCKLLQTCPTLILFCIGFSRPKMRRGHVSLIWSRPTPLPSQTIQVTLKPQTHYKDTQGQRRSMGGVFAFLSVYFDYSYDIVTPFFFCLLYIDSNTFELNYTKYLSEMEYKEKE